MAWSGAGITAPAQLALADNGEPSGAWIAATAVGWIAAFGAGLMAQRTLRRLRAEGERRAALERELAEKVAAHTSKLTERIDEVESELADRRREVETIKELEGALDQAVDGIAMLDIGGSARFINPAWARMHSYEVPEALGHHLSLFYTPDQMQDLIEPFLKQVRENGFHEGEAWHRKKDGTVFPTRLSFTLLHDTERGEMGYLGVARDITESRRAEEEQLRLEAKVRHNEKLKSLGVLAGGIAHDFNNLLTGVLGNSGLLLRELPPGSPLRDKVGQIEASAERAAELTDQLLAYAGEDQLIVRPLQLNELVETVQPSLEKLAADRLELQVELAEILPRVEANSGQLRQVLTALVTNSIEAIGEEPGGEILVTTELRDVTREELASGILDATMSPGPYVVLTVRDSGCGMDAGTRARMFDPFFSTKFTGRGLGLAATLGIVRGHGGTIRVESAIGRGTAIELLFPALEEYGDLAEAQGPSEESFEGWMAEGTVLVVDNEKIMRVVAKSILERHGFEVITAHDGLQAVEVFTKQHRRIRLVLLDLTMPEMDGVQSFREIRKVDPEALVILMTGYKEHEVRPGFAGRGLAGFIQKPFRPEELIRVVRGVLEG